MNEFPFPADNIQLGSSVPSILPDSSAPASTPSSSSEVRETFVARQPILDRSQGVYAYELLYRSGWSNSYDGTSSSRATTDVILNAVLHIGMDQLVGEKLAFVNFDRDLLLGELAGLLPSRIVIEVLETVAPDEDVVARCRDLKKQGFKVALDDVTDLARVGELITVADFLKVDFRATDRARQESLAKQAAKRNIRLLAEKVETEEEFERALRHGYSLAQGYFFAKPKIIPGSKIPPAKLTFLRLLREANRVEPDLAALEDALRREPMLVYKLLRYMNSAMFAWKQPIDSIRHALALLGSEQIRKWIGLLALSALTERTPPSLTPLAVIRARFCELIAMAAGLQSRSSELFLLGMLSLFGAILRRPAQEVVEHVDLNADIRGALLNEGRVGDVVATIYALALAFEAASWERVTELSARLRISWQTLSSAYAEAVRWSEDLGAI